MTDDLMNAILSMDAYNRGYDAGIVLDGSAIGGATISFDSSELGTVTVGGQSIGRDEEIGFYAIAYNLGTAGSIIAYRGTDDFQLDPYHGWSLGNGNYDSEQGQMAVEFYKEVAGSTDPLLASITTTGHSLGGGLAGYVASLYDRNAILFDSMAFQAAAGNTYVDSENGSEPALKDLVYGSSTPWTPDYVGITGHRIEGEVLGGMTPWGASSTIQPSLDLGDSVNLPGVISEAVARHSMATLVIRMFADVPSEVSGIGWRTAAKYFWPVLYDDQFAGSTVGAGVGLAGTNVTSEEYANILRQAIAYSAIKEADGTTIFGDTAIRSFYNDANELGDALATPTALMPWAEDISKTFVHYAGALPISTPAKAT